MTLARRALESAKITQNGLAHAIGVSVRQVNEWANGRSEPNVACRVILSEIVDGEPGALLLARLDEGRALWPDRRKLRAPRG